MQIGQHWKGSNELLVVDNSQSMITRLTNGRFQRNQFWQGVAIWLSGTNHHQSSTTMAKTGLFYFPIIGSTSSNSPQHSHDILRVWDKITLQLWSLTSARDTLIDKFVDLVKIMTLRPSKQIEQSRLVHRDVEVSSKELLRQLSYAIKNQLVASKAPSRGFGTQNTPPRWFFMAQGRL